MYKIVSIQGSFMENDHATITLQRIDGDKRWVESFTRRVPYSEAQSMKLGDKFILSLTPVVLNHHDALA